MASPFAGVSVLEYASFIAGPYCTKLLADLGARVVKVEAPGLGDPSRRYGPFPWDEPHPEASGLYHYLNTNKRSITLDPTTPTGRELFTRLSSCADVLVEDTPPGTMEKFGLDYQRLKQVNPRLVYVSITPYGQTGPKAPWRAYHINSFHASGEGYTLPGGAAHAQFPQRAPVTGGVHIGEYDAGLLAACATVAALLARDNWGEGQQVDVSKQEATLALNRIATTAYLDQGLVIDRSRSYEYGGIFPCKDGYVTLYPREDHQWKALVGVVGVPELAKDPRFLTRADRIRHGQEANHILGQWASSLTKREIYDQLGPTGCPAAYFATPDEVLESPQLNARSFFVETDHVKAGHLKYPSRPYRSYPCDPYRNGPAPSLGQQNEEVYVGELGLKREDLPHLRRGGVI